MGTLKALALITSIAAADFLVAVVIWTYFPPPAAATERSTKAVADFKRTHVCPSTGVAKNAPCPGQIVDHIMPLCAGGADDPSNMQWQSVEDAKKKDRVEAKLCALMKHCPAGSAK